MSSIIEGYNYDIFISYRQKDNKGDRWVSEFVEALKTELESTFKEEISVYFDINPHDGLLETHDVDASLKEKLKCLVFIPIISRTYCDPKSFAWEHEFKAFVEQASQDQFGLKVKLPNSNVASRVLPVRIHDLDTDDIKLFEGATGSMMRTLDFVFKTTSGVNRPLKPKEDHPNDNLGKAYYQDQINKVSLAIREITTAIGHYERKDEEVHKEVFKPLSSRSKSYKKAIISGSIIALVLIIIGFFLIPKLIKSAEPADISIAVLPFKNDSSGSSEESTAFINCLMDELISNLQTIKKLRVLGRTSVEQYRNNVSKSNPQIARELGVTYIVEGSGQKYGNSFNLRVRLINTKGKETLIWTRPYEQEIKETKDIFSIQSQIAQSIAAELKAVITPEEKQLIEKIPTANLTAYDFYQRGREEQRKYSLNNKQALEKAEDMFYKSLEYDSTFALAYIGLATVYYDKNFWGTFYSKNFLDSALILTNKALSIDDQLSEGYIIKGNYYRDTGIDNIAIKEYDKALKINPNSWEAYNGKGNLYQYDNLVNWIDNLQKAASHNRDPRQLPGLLEWIGYAYIQAGFPEKADYYYLEAFKLNGDSVSYFKNLFSLELLRGNEDKAIEFMKKAVSVDSTNPHILNWLGERYLLHEQYRESLKYYRKYIKSIETYPEGYLPGSEHRIGLAYWENGYKKEGEFYFNKQIKNCEGMIKLGRFQSKKLFTYYDLAAVYAFLGEREKAYENLKVFNQRKTMAFWAISLIKVDPLFNTIRDEPEFQKIVRDVEAKYQAEHERVMKWLEENKML